MKTVFIIGCPRSGTTYLLRLLASNQNFSWVSNELNLNPFDYSCSAKLRVYSKFYFGKKLYVNNAFVSKALPFCVEPWFFWNAHFDYFQWNNSFSEIPINATPNNNSNVSIEKVRHAVGEIMKYSGRSVFLSKYTDFPRVKLIKEAFPDSKFIHLVRDGRAVANSYFKKISSGDFNTSKEEKNWVSAWPISWQEQYSKIENKLLAFTLFQWKFFVSEILNELKEVNKNDFIQIKYSDLVNDTLGQTQNILDFVEVSMDSSMKYFIKNLPGIDMNYKWKEKLTDEEKKLYSEILIEDKFFPFLNEKKKQ